MFVKVKEKVLVNNWDFALLAQKYESWMVSQAAGALDVRTNVWKDDPMPIKKPTIAYLRKRGPDCFDWTYYMENNVDLKTAFKTLYEAWEHFVNLGAFEGRMHRFSCEMPVPTS